MSTCKYHSQPKANHTSDIVWILPVFCLFNYQYHTKSCISLLQLLFLLPFISLRVEPSWKRMSPCAKLSSEDVADCHGSQKKCSIMSFLKTHAFVLLTVVGIALGECFQETF